MRVLVVEDHILLAGFLSDVLVSEGFEVTVWQDDFSALLSSSPWMEYDVLICDLKLPGVSGAAVCVAARKANPHIRIILFTAVSWDSIGAELDSIVDAILTKPSAVEDIIKAVRG